MANQDEVNLSCSFCGKNQREVKKLIAGPTVYICDECIGLCNDIIAEEAGEAPKTVRLEIGRLLGDEASAADELRAYGDRSAAEVPDAVKRAISSLVAAAEALRTSVQRWSLPPEELAATPPVPAWLEPALAKPREPRNSHTDCDAHWNARWLLSECRVRPTPGSAVRVARDPAAECSERGGGRTGRNVRAVSPLIDPGRGSRYLPAPT